MDGFERSAAIELLDAIGRLKRDMIPPDAALAKPVKGQSFTIADVTRCRISFVAALRRRLRWSDRQSLRNYRIPQPDVCQQYRLAYRYILIDEAQDTSAAQYALLRALCGSEHRNVFVVADPAQSIYSFAGASSNTSRDFSRTSGLSVLSSRSPFVAQRRSLGTPGPCSRDTVPMVHGDLCNVPVQKD